MPCLLELAERSIFSHRKADYIVCLRPPGNAAKKVEF